MPRYKMVNGERIQFTAEEEAQRDQEEAEWAAGEKDRAMIELRSKRNMLLAETDWMALSDNTLSTEMADYRTQLRDLPSTISEDATVEEIAPTEYPTKP